MNEELLRLVQQLTDLAPQVWAVAMRQVRVEAAQGVALTSAFMGIMVGAILMGRRFNDDDDDVHRATRIRRIGLKSAAALTGERVVPHLPPLSVLKE